MTRAFAVMEALNAERTIVSLAALAHATALAKPTLVRLLDTLIAGGYVERLPFRGGYMLTERVLRLSSGFRQSDAVVTIARPFLSALTAKHKWPIAIAILDRDVMLVPIYTVKESPFTTDPYQSTRRIPILISSLGRAYLAFCPQTERDIIVNRLRLSADDVNAPAHDHTHIFSLVRTIRRRGYATNGPVRDKKFGGSHALAVPIMQGARVLATISLRYLNTVYTERQAAQRFLVSMQETAANIALALERE